MSNDPDYEATQKERRAARAKAWHEADEEARRKDAVSPPPEYGYALTCAEHERDAARRELEALKPWRDEAIRERDAALAALRELVACKDLKDSIDRDFTQSTGATMAQIDAKEQEYRRRKPLAWERARALVPGSTP